MMLEKFIAFLAPVRSFPHSYRLRCLLRRAATVTALTVAATLAVRASALAQPAERAPASRRAPSAPAVRDRATPTVGTGGIRGTVSSDLGNPLRHASVEVEGGGLRQPRTVSTDDGGNYELSDLPSGRYTVSASKAGQVRLEYGQVRAFEPGRTIDVSNGRVAERINFSLPSAGVVTGRIVDEMGEPVANAVVNALRYEYARGRRRLTIAGSAGRGPARTNEVGEFRLSGLAPADYVISATLGGAFKQSIGQAASFAYARTFFPGTVRVDEAQAVSVTAGQETSISIALAPARLIRVSGMVVDSLGKAASGGMLRLDQTGDMTSSGRLVPLQSDGTFTIELVALPGAYTVTAGTETSKGGEKSRTPEIGRVTLALGDADVSDVLVTTSPGATVSGEVVIDGVAPGAKATGVRMSVVPMEQGDAGGGSRSVPVSAERAFEVKGLFGRNLIFADIPSQSEWHVKGVYLDGEDITDIGVDVGMRPNVSAIKVVLTNQQTGVSGVVTTSGGQPAGDCVVLVFADEEAKWRHPMSRYVSFTRTGADGRYTITGLPPGKYRAIALGALDTSSATDPARLALLRPAAESVEAHTGGSAPLNLRLSTP